MISALTTGVLLLTLVSLLFLLGFSYMLWIMAVRETGNNKMLGQWLAGGVAVIAILLFLFTAFFTGREYQKVKNFDQVFHCKMMRHWAPGKKESNLPGLGSVNKPTPATSKEAVSEAKKATQIKSSVKSKNYKSKCTKKYSSKKSSQCKKKK